MSSSPASIRLSPRRLEQLKAIGSALNLSVTDTISHMIRKEIAAGTIPDTIPGIVISNVGDCLAITMDHGGSLFTKEHARNIALTIRDVADGKPGVVNLDVGFGVVRQGSGIKVMIPFAGPGSSRFNEAKAFSTDLARDLARLIEEAAA